MFFFTLAETDAEDEHVEDISAAEKDNTMLKIIVALVALLVTVTLAMLVLVVIIIIRKRNLARKGM